MPLPDWFWEGDDDEPKKPKPPHPVDAMMDELVSSPSTMTNPCGEIALGAAEECVLPVPPPDTSGEPGFITPRSKPAFQWPDKEQKEADRSLYASMGISEDLLEGSKPTGLA